MRFRLSDIHISAVKMLHGPVSATLQTPTAVGLTGFEAVRGGNRSIAGLALAAGLAVVAGGWSLRRHRRGALP